MTIKNLYPSVRPTLDLNFAQTKRLDPRITYSRSSSGSSATYIDNTGVLRTAAANQPRFDHDPATGESLGLLLEAAGTNLVTYSEDFSQWSQRNHTFTSNAATAPDGTTTADKIAPNSGTFFPVDVYQTVTPITTPITLSVWAKADGFNVINLNLANYGDNGVEDAFLKVNVSTGTLVENSGSAGGFWTSYSITPFPNGWYRITATTTDSTDGDTVVQLQVCEDDGSPTVTTGDGTKGILIWGAQLEESPYATSYIPTDGTPGGITRAADVAQITGSNFSSWYNQNQGTIATDLIPSTVGSFSIWTVSDGTNSERMLSYTGTTFSFYVQDGGVSQVQYNAGGYTAGVPWKAASAFATNNFNYARNGVVYTTDTSGSLPTVDRLQLMAGYAGGQIQSGHLRRFTFYPVRLPDATLQTLTS